MNDKEICRYIQCPIYFFYKAVGKDNYCFYAGPCEKINREKYIWKINPFARPGIVFTAEENELIQAFVNDDNELAAQEMILDHLEKEAS